MGLAAVAVVRGLTTPDPADLLPVGGHREALRLVEEQLPAWRLAARLWPGQFRDALAVQLMNKSMALLAAHRHGEALAAAEVLFLHGQLLGAASRHREAARSLAQAWHLAAKRATSVAAP